MSLSAISYQIINSWCLFELRIRRRRETVPRNDDIPRAGVAKHSGCHTLKHSLTTHWLESGYDSRTIREVLAHSDVSRTVTHTHVPNRRTRAYEVRLMVSPGDANCRGARVGALGGLSRFFARGTARAGHARSKPAVLVLLYRPAPLCIRISCKRECAVRRGV
ncbi:MAG: tyrosine-type recombinase/integrase [Candidatus Eisenbacteria bacterium]|nr:tyrosine-type recombinase/integrase [Candidatus Eisenbacteria bacterium]